MITIELDERDILGDNAVLTDEERESVISNIATFVSGVLTFVGTDADIHGQYMEWALEQAVKDHQEFPESEEMRADNVDWTLSHTPQRFKLIYGAFSGVVRRMHKLHTQREQA